MAQQLILSALLRSPSSVGSETRDWVSILDDLPVVQPGMKHVSVNVIAMLKNGRQVRAFYADHYDEWYFSDTCRRIKQEVIAWKSIEEVNPHAQINRNRPQH